MSRKNVQRLAIVLVVIALIVVFKVFELERYFTLTYIKSQQQQFAQLYAENTFLVLGIYTGVYIVATALSLPGAVVLTLAGGALFGFWAALVVVSFASSIGATLACFVSRFLLREWVQNRFGERLKTVNQGIEREGAFYLFTVRLIPVFPFFVINLVMGLTGMPLRTFYWVSQLGMLPGTAVFVNAGKQLGEIQSASGILSPSLLISFAILGLFPITVKKLMRWYRSRKGKKPLPAAE
ncbi:MAG: TVP38/TMEM64 family protein [Deltaproteobacteria bacterium]|nr:TVP38/TMEM64 family protein [Deltaproteobacteria bacterium]